MLVVPLSDNLQHDKAHFYYGNHYGVYFNISVTSGDLQMSRLSLISKFECLVSAGEANV